MEVPDLDGAGHGLKLRGDGTVRGVQSPLRRGGAPPYETQIMGTPKAQVANRLQSKNQTFINCVILTSVSRTGSHRDVNDKNSFAGDVLQIRGGRKLCW